MLLCSALLRGLVFLPSGRAGPSESGHFQGLPKAPLSCLPSCSRRFPAGYSVSIREEAVTQPSHKTTVDLSDCLGQLSYRGGHGIVPSCQQGHHNKERRVDQAAAAAQSCSRRSSLEFPFVGQSRMVLDFKVHREENQELVTK